MDSLTISQFLKRVTERFGEHESARLDAEVLVAFALALSRTQLYTFSDRVLSREECSIIDKFVSRRRGGEPIAYIVGFQEFWSLEFKVTDNTLIPRPETEHLVEFALENIPVDREYKVLDLGTGSGAIAISIASERPLSQVFAIDNSQAALDIAMENAKKLQVDNVVFQRSDWFNSLAEQKFDLLVSNPPYIEEDDENLSIGDVLYEPQSALVSGSDGLDDIREIIHQAKEWLTPDGTLVFEHGWNQAEKVRLIFENALYEKCASSCDYAGIERITAGKLKAKKN